MSCSEWLLGLALVGQRQDSGWGRPPCAWGGAERRLGDCSQTEPEGGVVILWPGASELLLWWAGHPDRIAPPWVLVAAGVWRLISSSGMGEPSCVRC